MSRKHNVPAFIHPCHCALCYTYRLMHNERDVSMQGHCVSGTNHFGDQVSQKIYTETHRFRTSHHPIRISYTPTYIWTRMNILNAATPLWEYWQLFGRPYCLFSSVLLSEKSPQPYYMLSYAHKYHKDVFMSIYNRYIYARTRARKASKCGRGDQM